MHMTFDDVDDYIDARVLMVDTSSEYIEKDDVIDLIYKLIKEYAPTIEMTKEQLHVLNYYRKPDLYDGDYVFNAFYEDTHTIRLGLLNNNIYDNLTEKQLMQAWLHPETIKVVDK